MSRPIAGTAAALLLLCACSSQPDDSTSVASAPDVTFAPVEPTTVPTTAPTTVAATTATLPPTTVPLAAGAVTLSPFATGLTKPLEVAFRVDDPTLFVAEQDGFVVPIRDGVAGAPVLDVRDKVSDGGEQGLLGLAFHPSRPLAYVDYTDRNGDTMIVEYAVGADGTFDTASARTVLKVDQPYANHNGGKVVFGPDGYLYVGLGDGGSGGDPERRALNVSQLLGKILRIDPTGGGEGQPYTVPPDNPFVGVTGARPEIWSVGLRNPWRFDFDSATGDLWIADVGQNKWEEVNMSPVAAGAGRGVNFGWSAWEGTHRFNDDQNGDGAAPPVYEYPHGADGCSISGGTVYRGSTIPSLVGWYVFSDYCGGKVWALDADGTIVTLGVVPSAVVSAVSDGPDGSVYVLAIAEGTLYRLDPA